MAIARILSAVSVATSTATLVQSVSLSAGSNRMFLVSVGGMIQNGIVVVPAIPVVTYGGLPLRILRGPVPGASSSVLADATRAISLRGVYILGLLESDLALLPLGANDLSVTWDSVNQILWGFVAGWSLLTGVKQSLDVRSVNGASMTAGSFATIGDLLDPGAVGDAVFSCAFNNASAGSIQLQFNGAPLTEDFDVALSSSAARIAGAALIPVASAAPCTFDMTYTLGTQATVIVAVRIEAADTPVPGFAEIQTMKEHPWGQAIPLRAFFANLAGARTNPSFVNFRVGRELVSAPPDPSATDAVMGVDLNVTNPATGEFLYSLPPPAVSGIYDVQVIGSGSLQASATLQFRVLPNPFA